LVTLLYFLFPGLIIDLLFGKSYLSVVPYIGFMGVIFTLYSLINLLVSYAISCYKTNVVYILVFGTVLEILLLSVFHTGIWQLICDMMFTMGIILGGLAIFLIYSKGAKKCKTSES
jgi:membrane-associated HD superfamily phosphohydrolase